MATDDSSAGSIPVADDRYNSLRSFDESKAGVKGLVDAGITQVPSIFIRPQEEIATGNLNSSELAGTHLTIPVIDVGNMDDRRSEVVAGVRQAAADIGFFQVVNHGVEVKVLEEVLASVRGFHEQSREVKEEYYSRELMRRVKYSSNFDLYQSKYANWRDTLFCVMGPDPLDPLELPPICRESVVEYSKQLTKLGVTLFELLSEALGLRPDHLKELDCAKGHALLGHYYPACPQPELTMGTTKHSDPDFLTILLQDDIGGLQIFHQSLD